MKIVLLLASLVISMAYPSENLRTEPKSAMAEPVTLPKLSIKISTKTFTATLADNPTTKAFVAQLPLTLTMTELNNNEKYAQLPKSVPTNASIPASIQAGDLMMYGSSTLVLFYKGFNTSYSYTKIGKIDDISGLNTALGAGDVKVSFEIQND